MNGSFQKRLGWILFGVVLLGAAWGWLWVLKRLVANEAEVATSRVKLAEERYLTEVAQELARSVKESLPQTDPGEEWIPELARNGVMSGVWFETSTGGETSLDSKIIKTWREGVRTGSFTSKDFEAAIKNGELTWGWVEDGRDALAGIALSLLRKPDPSEQLVELLEERVWEYDGPRLKPAFRLALIRELQKHRDDPALERLARAESIRVVEGRVAEMNPSGEFEVIRDEVMGTPVLVFWSKDDLRRLAESASGQKVEILANADENRAAVRIPGFARWPLLALGESGVVGSKALDSSGRALLWVGGLTGVLVLALSMAAALVAGKAQRIARMRTDLAASVAHELRTPLAGQRVLLESLLDRTDQTAEEQREYVAMAFRENKRLSRLAEEFLTFSRLERGILTLENEEVEASEVVERAVESLREKWEGDGCSLEIKLEDDLPRIAGDGQALVTVLRNLLENAWKYSKAPREVEVRACRADQGVMLMVKDNGEGIPEREQERIFKQFYRADRRLARAQEGLGLGLSIVKRLVDAMGGRIEVESEEGQGSEFRIWLKEVS